MGPLYAVDGYRLYLYSLCKDVPVIFTDRLSSAVALKQKN